MSSQWASLSSSNLYLIRLFRMDAKDVICTLVPLYPNSDLPGAKSFMCVCTCVRVRVHTHIHAHTQSICKYRGKDTLKLKKHTKCSLIINVIDSPLKKKKKKTVLATRFATPCLVPGRSWPHRRLEWLSWFKDLGFHPGCVDSAPCPPLHSGTGAILK